jgi:hypothetical protein
MNSTWIPQKEVTCFRRNQFSSTVKDRVVYWNRDEISAFHFALFHHLVMIEVRTRDQSKATCRIIGIIESQKALHTVLASFSFPLIYMKPTTSCLIFFKTRSVPWNKHVCAIKTAEQVLGIDVPNWSKSFSNSRELSTVPNKVRLSNSTLLNDSCTFKPNILVWLLPLFGLVSLHTLVFGF